MAQFLQKEIDTQNMNSVVAALTPGIDVAVSQAQQTVAAAVPDNIRCREIS